jgi:hypothetical protein
MSEIAGPVVEARNWSADAEGSIHDDATASKLGFRGGTVAGSIHMDQFVPVLLEAYGDEWLRRGYLSLYFQNATTDREPVQVFGQEPASPGEPIDVRMERTDGLDVMRGNAGLGSPEASALHTRDLRTGDGAGLRILAELRAGLELGPLDVKLASKTQRERLEKKLISDPLPVYGEVATPSTLVELLWRAPTDALRRRIGRSVGLFGAIEVAHLDGPVPLDRDYQVRAEVVGVGESPKTEFLWFDSEAVTPEGVPVASMRMLLRFMKASSPEYRD